MIMPMKNYFIDDWGFAAEKVAGRSESSTKHEWVNTKTIMSIGDKRVLVFRCSKCSIEGYRGRDSITVLNEDKALDCKEYMIKDIIL